MPIVAVSMSKADYDELDAFQKQNEFRNRSEVIRHAIQSLLKEHMTLEQMRGEITATITMVYIDNGKNDKCHQIQHDHSQLVLSMMHSHSINGDCIEVLVVGGSAIKINSFAKKLRAQKQVKKLHVTIF